jgi:hypothetical protein
VIGNGGLEKRSCCNEALQSACSDTSPVMYLTFSGLGVPFILVRIVGSETRVAFLFG